MDETAAPPIQENFSLRRIKNYFIFMSPVLFLILIKIYLINSDSGTLPEDAHFYILFFISSLYLLMISPNVTIMFDPSRVDIAKTFLKMLACIFILPILHFFVNLGGDNNSIIRDLIFIIPICAILISKNISEISKNFRTVIDPLPIWIIIPVLLLFNFRTKLVELNQNDFNFLISPVIVCLISVFIVILTPYNSKIISLIGRVLWGCIGIISTITLLPNFKFFPNISLYILSFDTRIYLIACLYCSFPFFIALGPMKNPNPNPIFKIIRILFFSLALIVSLLLLMTLIAQSFLENSLEPLSDTVLPLFCGLAAIRLLLNEITGAPKFDEGWVIIAASVMIVF